MISAISLHLTDNNILRDMDILTPHSGRCPASERDVSHNAGHTHPGPDIVCITAPLSQSPGPQWPDDDDYERGIEDVLITSSHVSPT